MILVNGDSFTAGEELQNKADAWPYILGTQTINYAGPGYSNDAIVRTTVEAIESGLVFDYAIIAWTTPNRIEVNGNHLTPTSHRKYGAMCDQVFHNWDQNWACRKFHTQVALLNGYLSNRKIPYLFVRTFDVPTTDLGNWADGSMVEWMGDCPKGNGGHPLVLGHQRIAEKIYEYIRN